MPMFLSLSIAGIQMDPFGNCSKELPERTVAGQNLLTLNFKPVIWPHESKKKWLPKAVYGNEVEQDKIKSHIPFKSNVQVSKYSKWLS